MYMYASIKVEITYYNLRLIEITFEKYAILNNTKIQNHYIV